MQTSNKGRALTFGVALVMLSIGAANANLISNGAFTTGDFTDWTLGNYGYGGGTGNSGAGSPGLPGVTSFDVTGGGAQNAATFDVGLSAGTFGDGQGGGVSLSQNFTTAGGTINFSAAIANLDQGTNADGGTFVALINGVQIASDAFGSDTVSTHRASLLGSDVLSAGTYTLTIDISRIYFAGSNTPDQYITNIDVEGATGRQSSSVPEPFSLSLFGAGLFGAAAMRRRKAKRA